MKSSAPWAPALAVAMALAFWEIAVAAGWMSPLFFPAPSATLRALAHMTSQGTLLPHVSATLSRAVSGFGIGAASGVIMGALMALSPALGRFFDPLVAATHSVPKITLLPLAILVFGVGEAPGVALVALSSFYPTVIASMTGVRGIPPLYFDVARSFRASRFLIARRVVIPGALPSILGGIRVAVNLSLVITLSVELVFGERGLGRLIWRSWQTMRMEELFATLAVTSLLGVASNLGLQALSRRLMLWQTNLGD